jgi:hypothetical protein
MEKKRPIGITILAVLAGIAAVMAVIHTLQMLHLFPVWLGPVRFFTVDLVGAILWGLLAMVYIWLVRNLWSVDPQAWNFLVALSTINLVLDVVTIIGYSTFAAMLPSIVVSAAILIYCLLPGTKEAFGQP